jgi:hypothetical protein
VNAGEADSIKVVDVDSPYGETLDSIIDDSKAIAEASDGVLIWVSGVDWVSFVNGVDCVTTVASETGSKVVTVSATISVTMSGTDSTVSTVCVTVSGVESISSKVVVPVLGEVTVVSTVHDAISSGNSNLHGDT